VLTWKIRPQRDDPAPARYSPRLRPLPSARRRSQGLWRAAPRQRERASRLLRLPRVSVSEVLPGAREPSFQRVRLTDRDATPCTPGSTAITRSLEGCAARAVVHVDGHVPAVGRRPKCAHALHLRRGTPALPPGLHVGCRSVSNTCSTSEPGKDALLAHLEDPDREDYPFPSRPRNRPARSWQRAILPTLEKQPRRAPRICWWDRRATPVLEQRRVLRHVEERLLDGVRYCLSAAPADVPSRREDAERGVLEQAEVEAAAPAGHRSGGRRPPWPAAGGGVERLEPAAAGGPAHHGGLRVGSGIADPFLLFRLGRSGERGTSEQRDQSPHVDRPRRSPRLSFAAMSPASQGWRRFCQLHARWNRVQSLCPAPRFQGVHTARTFLCALARDHQQRVAAFTTAEPAQATRPPAASFRRARRVLQ